MKNLFLKLKIFPFQTVNEPAVISRLISTHSKSNGQVLKAKPRCLTKNQASIRSCKKLNSRVKKSYIQSLVGSEDIPIKNSSSPVSCLLSHFSVLQVALVEIKCERAICLELFKDSKSLGRITCRYGGNTIAAGMVIEIT